MTDAPRKAALQDREKTMTGWVDVAPDNSGRTVDILPLAFDLNESNCVMCGGTLDIGWECIRCGADHFPAVKRLIAQEAD